MAGCVSTPYKGGRLQKAARRSQSIGTHDEEERTEPVKVQSFEQLPSVATLLHLAFLLGTYSITIRPESLSFHMI